MGTKYAQTLLSQEMLLQKKSKICNYSTSNASHIFYNVKNVNKGANVGCRSNLATSKARRGKLVASSFLHLELFSTPLFCVSMNM